MPEHAVSAVIPGARQRFGVNAASNLAYFVASTLVMLWYVPFLLGHLGVAAYGMIPLTNAVVLCAAILAESLNTAICRHLAIALNRGDIPAARRTFNGAAALTLGLMLGLLPLIAGLTWFLPRLFAVPSDLVDDTHLLFLGVCTTLLTGVAGGLFGASSQIRHRFDLRNLARALTLGVRVGLVAACFALWPASLAQVGIALMVSGVAGLACEIVIWRALTPELAFEPRAATRAEIARCGGLGAWAGVNMAGMLLLTGTELLVVNRLFGQEATGRYGAILLLPALLLAAAEIVLPMLSPAILARYANGDRAGVEHLTTRAIRLMGVALALPAGLLCGLGAPLLRLWLGPDFVPLAGVLALLCGHLALNLALRPLAYVLTAHARLKVPALASLAFGAAGIVLAVVLAAGFGWGLAGVPAGFALVWTFKNAVFLALYTAGILGLPRWTFTRALAPALAGLLGVTLAGRLAEAVWAPATWPALLVAGAGIAAAYGAVACAAFLSRADRRLVLSLLPRPVVAAPRIR